MTKTVHHRIFGWIRNGEWLEYTIQNNQSGFYTATINAAKPWAGEGSVEIYVNGLNQTQFAIAQTRSWRSYETMDPFQLELPSGEVRLRFKANIANGGGFNLNWVEFN